MPREAPVIMIVLCSVMGQRSAVCRAAPRYCSREALFPHHRPRIVECPAEAGHHLVDFGLADDQRRAEGDDVARHVAQYGPMMLGAAHQIGGNAGLRVEALPGRLVADKLDPAHWPAA